MIAVNDSILLDAKYDELDQKNSMLLLKRINSKRSKTIQNIVLNLALSEGVNDVADNKLLPRVNR